MHAITSGKRKLFTQRYFKANNCAIRILDEKTSLFSPSP